MLSRQNFHFRHDLLENSKGRGGMEQDWDPAGQTLNPHLTS